MKDFIKMSDVYKSHREIVLIGIVCRYYDKVYSSRVSDIAGSLSVADFFSDFVDVLMDDIVYTMAMRYAIAKEDDLSIGANVWGYYHMHFNTSLDWYYFDKAKQTIDKFISDYKD